jgi:ketosteroid isomerase-like protein
MRYSYLSCLFIASFSLSAAAAEVDHDFKQAVEKIEATYTENYNKQNGAGIAALYATGGMLFNATGPHTDIAQAYEGLFKSGFNHNETTVNQVWPLGADTLLAAGEYLLTGKNSSGAPIESKGIWTSVEVREDGVWKIRMRAGVQKAPPPKD